MKITIYELLGLIKEGKAPQKIKVTGTIYYFNENYEMYLTKKENENYEVALGGMDKDINLIANAFNEVVEIIEEEKEIEFEDIESFGVHYSWDYIDYKNIEELKKYTNKDFQNIFDTLDKLIKNQKKLIDAVNKLNKGE